MSELVFSYAENNEGQMVHIDSVPQGLKCACICPNCKEKLLARHGKVRAHGFAHHSDTRGANLKICYMVIVYKLAEQIIQTHKRIHSPSYHGIIKESDIEFTQVKIDNNFDRDDKQPDVIATTKEGQQFLIEFTFNYKVQRKRAVDYKNLTCIEIDLSEQTLESLEGFLLRSNENRRWLNNQLYFDNIEAIYRKANKQVRVVDISECRQCPIIHRCCAIKDRNNNTYIEIENNGSTYRICKPKEYSQAKLNWEKEQQERIQRQQEQTESIAPEHRTCFKCINNLGWMCRDARIAHCGPYQNMQVPKNTPPETAKHCRGFKRN